MSANDRRGDQLPCDLHQDRIKRNADTITAVKLTLYGQEGTGGVVKKVNDAITENQNFKTTFFDFKKIFYIFNITILFGIVGILVKLVIFSGK